jgi:hypothetical protein
MCSPAAGLTSITLPDREITGKKRNAAISLTLLFGI